VVIVLRRVLVPVIIHRTASPFVSPT
jgi:hypothetical protein